jgi:hypothetical protein
MLLPANGGVKAKLPVRMPDGSKRTITVTLHNGGSHTFGRRYAEVPDAGGFWTSSQGGLVQKDGSFVTSRVIKVGGKNAPKVMEVVGGRVVGDAVQVTDIQHVAATIDPRTVKVSTTGTTLGQGKIVPDSYADREDVAMLRLPARERVRVAAEERIARAEDSLKQSDAVVQEMKSGAKPMANSFLSASSPAAVRSQRLASALSGYTYAASVLSEILYHPQYRSTAAGKTVLSIPRPKYAGKRATSADGLPDPLKERAITLIQQVQGRRLPLVVNELKRTLAQVRKLPDNTRGTSSEPSPPEYESIGSKAFGMIFKNGGGQIPISSAAFSIRGTPSFSHYLTPHQQQLLKQARQLSRELNREIARRASSPFAILSIGL